MPLDEESRSGTLITFEEENTDMEQTVISGIAFSRDEAKITVLGVPDRPGKDNAYVLSSEKARSVLGWADRIPLETGISETIDWVRDNFAKLNKFPCEYIHKE